MTVGFSKGDGDQLICVDDVTRNYFISIESRYPNLVFDDRNDRGDKELKTAFIYPKDLPRRGNVFIAVYQHRDCFDFVMKKSIMTEEEIKESAQNWKRDNSMRGCVRRTNFVYKSDLLNYLIPKLDRIEAAK